MISGGTEPILPGYRHANKWTISPAVIAVLLMFQIPVCGWPEEGLRIRPEEQFRYAEACFRQEDYATAVAEYKRFAFFFPDDPRIGYVHYRIGLAFFRSGRYADAIRFFNRFSDTFGDTRYTRQGGLLAARAHLALDQKGEAILALNELTAMTEDIETRDRAFYALGWIWLEHPSYLLSDAENENHAFSYFQVISPEGQEQYQVAALKRELARYSDIPQKNPFLAGSLSIIPGLGQVYCGRYRDGLTAFVLNGAFAAAAYEAVDKELYALGGLIGAVGAGFYAGNIYGAVSGAHKYNRSARKNFVDTVKQKVGVTISGPTREADWRVGLGVAF